VVKRLLGKALTRSGYRVVKDAPQRPAPDLDAEVVEAMAAVKPFTRVQSEGLVALWDAVRYVCRAEVPGAIVECGVWRGGAAMLAARALRAAGAQRDLWLYDTYEGMTPPSANDVRWDGTSAAEMLSTQNRDNPMSTWCVADLDDVQANLASTAYPADRIRYVVGKVEETLPAQAPTDIAVLRLDTDFYESTKAELEHLMPRVSPGGVLLLDDYGYWQGARKAVDDYLAETGARLLLHRVGWTGRAAVVGPLGDR
jgi:hypothetical protein